MAGTDLPTLALLESQAVTLSALRLLVERLGIDEDTTSVSVEAGGSTLAAVSLSRVMQIADAAIERAQLQEGDRIARALRAASHALRSYQHGNTAPDLAREVADACDAVLAQMEDH